MTWYVSEPEGIVQEHLEVLQPDERTWKKAVVCGYGYGGIVKVTYEGDANDVFHWVDLTQEQCRWVL